MKFRRAHSKLVGEQGITLIELLYVFVIISILAAISITAYALYKKNVEYAKAIADQRNVKTAFEVGDQDAPDGLMVPFSFTSKDGGPVVGPISEVVPGAMTSKGVMLGLMYRNCPNNTLMVVNRLITAIPCNSDKYSIWFRMCDGTEVSLPDQPLWAGACDI